MSQGSHVGNLVFRSASRSRWSESKARALVLIVVLMPSGVLAGEIANVSVTSSGTNAADNECGPPRLFQYTVNKEAEGSCGFASRFKQVLGVDVRASGGTEELVRSSNHRVAFNVIAEGDWEVVVEHERIGDIGVRQDGGKCGRTELSPITATVAGGGTLIGTLNTSTNYTACNCNDCSGDCPGDTCSGDQTANHFAVVDDYQQATISGTGDALITIDFSWSATVESIANILGGGDESAVRLGLSLGDDPTWLAGCADPFDALDYVPDPEEGHRITVSLVSDELGILLTNAYKCQELGVGPCTYYAFGQVEGCADENYTVFLDYLDPNSELVCSASVVVTDGNPEWSSVVTCPGQCVANQVEFWATNDPGKSAGRPDVPPRAPVRQNEVCWPLSTSIPALGFRGLVLLVVTLLLIGGFLLIRKRF